MTAHITDEPTARLDALRTLEKDKTCGKKAVAEYFIQHQRRFNTTFAICRQLVPSKNASVLDIGRSPFTEMLLSHYLNVSTLGLDPIDDDGGHRENGNVSVKNHTTFNINDAKDPNQWPALAEKFDLITFCETLEHLHTAPEYAITFLSNLLTPTGKLLITTPNAATLKNRIALLLGRNPFEKIRLYDKNPGHFREYTVNELRSIGQNLNLEVTQCRAINFYHSRYLAPFKMIPVFKDSIVAVFQQKGI
jgi:2-polyprenyl-3-methyl-5-hydroxy-6-metoxy-1,4-benzoquinol methylase